MSLTNLSKKIIIATLFLVPFVPLIVVNSLYFPFIVGKAFAFRILVEIIFAAWLVLMLLDRRYRPKLSWISDSIGAFLLIIFLANIFGLNPYFSFWSNFERMEGFVTLLHLGAFFVVLGSVFDEKLWKKFFHISLGVSVFISFYSLFQVFGWVEIRQGGARVDGTMGNAIYLALYLMFHVFIALFYFLKEQKHRVFYFLIILLSLLIIYLSASRGVILGLGLGLFFTFLLIFLLEKERIVLKRNVGISLLTLIVLVSGFIFFKDSGFVRKSQTLGRLAELSVKEVKKQGRFFIWPMAVDAFRDKPILGYGQENFNFVFNKYYNPKVFNQEPWFDRVHNTFLDWLVAGGILGLLAYITILFSVFFALWKSSVSVTQKSVLTGLLLGYVFQSIFVFDNLTSYILVYMIFAFIWHLETRSRPAGKNQKEIPTRRQNVMRLQQNEQSKNEKSIKYFVVPIIVVVLVFVLYVINLRPYLSNRLIIHAMCPHVVTRIDNNGKKISFCEPDPQETLLSYKKIFDQDGLGSREALFQFLEQTLSVNRDIGVPADLKEEYLKVADSAIEIVSQKFIFDVRTLLVIGSFYSRMFEFMVGQKQLDTAQTYLEQSFKYLEKAKEISPMRQDVYFELGSIYFSSNDVKRALETFKFAFDLEPNNGEARIRYSLILMYSGDVKLADKILEDGGGNFYYDPRIINALQFIKQYSKILSIWQKRVTEDPNNIEFRKSLAAAYILNGNSVEAINALEGVVKLRPELKKDLDFMIAEIRAGRGQALLEQ